MFNFTIALTHFSKAVTEDCFYFGYVSQIYDQTLMLQKKNVYLKIREKSSTI